MGVGVSLCYDIRFPYLYGELADRGASVITVSASWGAGPGKLDQWTLLARPGAGRWLLYRRGRAGLPRPGPGRQSTDRGRGSLVASPRGEVLAAAGPDPQLLVCDIDPDLVGTVRDTVGMLRNRVAPAQTHRAQSAR